MIFGIPVETPNVAGIAQFTYETPNVVSSVIAQYIIFE
jgi:hypothetical protein